MWFAVICVAWCRRIELTADRICSCKRRWWSLERSRIPHIAKFLLDFSSQNKFHFRQEPKKRLNPDAFMTAASEINVAARWGLKQNPRSRWPKTKDKKSCCRNICNFKLWIPFLTQVWVSVETPASWNTGQRDSVKFGAIEQNAMPQRKQRILGLLIIFWLAKFTHQTRLFMHLSWNLRLKR